MKVQSQPDLFTAHQLAARWSVSEKTLERWRTLGTGPAFVKLASRVLYPIGEIRTYEQHRTSNTTSGQRPARSLP